MVAATALPVVSVGCGNDDKLESVVLDSFVAATVLIPGPVEPKLI